MQHRILTCLLFAFFPSLQAEDPPSKAQESYLVPYRLSDIKHVVVRVKVDGKGPFNFIVDTGAPAVYFGNEIARKLGKEVKEEGYWETFDKVEIEGGVKLKGIKARVEEPFQLVGINKMNAAGVRYHGVLGYAVLAQYQIEYDFTQPHLKWTKLDWTPPPPIALGSLSEGATKNMKAMIGLSSLATSLMPKKEDAKIIYRGFIDQVGYLDDALVQAKTLARSSRIPDRVNEIEVVMMRRPHDPARSPYATSPNAPITSLVPLSIPGIDRSKLPTFLYAWQPDPGLERLGGKQ